MLLLLWLGGYRAVVVIQAAVTASKEGIQKPPWTDPAALPDHRVSCGVWYSRIQKHEHNQTQQTSSQTDVIQPRCCCYLQFLGKACCIFTGCRLSWGSTMCRAGGWAAAGSWQWDTEQGSWLAPTASHQGPWVKRLPHWGQQQNSPCW